MPRYRIFCLEGKIKDLPAEVTVEEQYPAFVVVSAAEEAIEEVRQRCPVEEMLLPKGPPVVPNVADLPDVLAKPRKRGPYLGTVRFYAPIQKVWLKEIERFGCEIYGVLGSSTIVVKCPNKPTLQKLNQHPKVNSYQAYIPYIGLNAEFFEEFGPGENNLKRHGKRYSPLSGMVVAGFFTAEERRRAKQYFRRQGIGNISESGETNLIINLLLDKNRGKAVQTIARRPGLRFLEQRQMLDICNNRAKNVIAEKVTLPIPAGGLELDGEGEIVAITDTGLDSGDINNLHPDFRGRVVDISSVPITDDDWRRRIAHSEAKSDQNGHGTHVAGSILGNGACSEQFGLPEAPFQGLAPKATLVFQGIEHKVEWTNLGKDYWIHLVGVATPPAIFKFTPENLWPLFLQAYQQQACIHLLALTTTQGKYFPESMYLDGFVWHHKDYLLVVAAGNSGLSVPHPTQPEEQGDVVALKSVYPPATAKNCLTVGAIENDRLDDTYGVPVFGGPHIPDVVYGDDPQQLWPNPPFQTDPLVNVEHIFTISSRGPGPDNRRKPEVVAPGSFILSTRSQALPADHKEMWATPKDEGKQYYTYNSGTSMAAALVTGCAVLVRQFLRRENITSAPTAALLKAALIHSAQYTPYEFAHPESRPPHPTRWWADNEQGWGRVDLKQVLRKSDDTIKVLFFGGVEDELKDLAEGEVCHFEIEVTDSVEPLQATLVYTDYPGQHLMNNLNLYVNDVSGNRFFGNDFMGSGLPDTTNNVEKVIVEQPQPGVWSINVAAIHLPQGGTQDFALVVSGPGLNLLSRQRRQLNII